MPTEAARKDSTLALALAQTSGVPLFAIQGAHTVYELALAGGLGRLDYASIAQLWEGWTKRSLANRGETDGRMSEASYDVVVVGGGNAGFSAAHAAREAGASVLLLEKTVQEEAGGNSYYAAGAFRVAFDGLEDLLPLLGRPDGRAARRRRRAPVSGDRVPPRHGAHDRGPV